MLYAELFFGESLEYWLAAHCNAFDYFGGVPQRVMVDNCKTAVIAPGRGGEAPTFNQHYAACANHYGFTIWLKTTANVRTHRTTRKRPLELFEQEERLALKKLPPVPYGCAAVKSCVAWP